jgi:outer membrane protein
VSRQVTVETRTVPEFDISWFIHRRVSLELAMPFPQRHGVSLSGVRIGTFKHLPPTLTLQYHFAPERDVSPYVGAGVNYTRFSNVNLGPVTLERQSTGLALQAGIDFRINAAWSINVDLKKVQIHSDVFLGGTKLTNLKLDPILLGVGIGLGYRF